MGPAGAWACGGGRAPAAGGSPPATRRWSREPEETQLPPTSLAKHGAPQDDAGSGSQLQPPLYQVTAGFDNPYPQVLRFSDI